MNLIANQSKEKIKPDMRLIREKKNKTLDNKKLKLKRTSTISYIFMQYQLS